MYVQTSEFHQKTLNSTKGMGQNLKDGSKWAFSTPLFGNNFPIISTVDVVRIGLSCDTVFSLSGLLLPT